jgi:hypothetical protein
MGREGTAQDNSMMDKVKCWDKEGYCVSTDSWMQKCWGKESYCISKDSSMQKVM